MSTESRLVRARGWLAALPGALLAILAPKCPLCVAGYLASFGAGAAAPLVVWGMRPLGIALALLALAFKLRRRFSLAGSR